MVGCDWQLQAASSFAGRRCLLRAWLLVLREGLHRHAEQMPVERGAAHAFPALPPTTFSPHSYLAPCFTPCSYGLSGEGEEEEAEESPPAGRGRRAPQRGTKRKLRSSADDSDEDFELDDASGDMSVDK